MELRLILGELLFSTLVRKGDVDTPSIYPTAGVGTWGLSKVEMGKVVNALLLLGFKQMGLVRG